MYLRKMFIRAAIITGLSASLLLSAGCSSTKKPGQEAAAAAGESKAEENKNEDKNTEDGNTEESRKDGLCDLKKFQCELLDGGTFSEADFANKDLTVINFWNTTCPPCLEEIPEIDKIREALPDNVQLYLVSLDESKFVDDVKEVISKLGYTGPVAMCGDGDMEELRKGLLYVPTTLFFDKDGNRIGATMVGSAPDIVKAYNDNITAALAEIGK